MRRIIWHHTGGGYDPGAADLRAYHRLITGDGEVVEGTHPIEDNAPGNRLRSGQYAAHVRGLNTGSIGIAICCMADGKWSEPRAARYFPRPAQIDAMLRETARLCRQYGIEPGRRGALSHAEVEPTLGVMQQGKWDFDYDPFGLSDTRDPVEVGNDLRARLRKLIAVPLDWPEPKRPTLRQGSRGEHVRELQSALSITADGIFGPQTMAEVKSFQRDNELLVDGIVGPQTWAALGL